MHISIKCSMHITLNFKERRKKNKVNTKSKAKQSKAECLKINLTFVFLS